MKYQCFKEMCLALKNDVDFEEFKILCSNRNYSEAYLKSIWEIYCQKPLEFVLYHEAGREIFNFVKHKEEVSKQTHLP